MKRLLLSILFFLLPACALAQEVSVTAEIYPYEAVARRPLRGSVSVTRSRSDEIDASSFQFEGSPLAVEFVKEVVISPEKELVISIYAFEIEGKEKGLYLLGPISVLVGGKRYSSTQTTYEVKQSILPRKIQKAQLALRTFVDAPEAIYPGQRFWLIYRFYFTGSIDLVREELPLLKPEGLQTIGEKQVRDFKQGSVNIREVRQLVEAKEPGVFNFPASVIEGRAYRGDPSGKRVYAKETIRAEAPSVDVTVLPFPSKGKPPSFHGALGQYTLQVSLLTEKEVEVGEKVQLSLVISGRGAFNTVTMEDVCCLPGVSGFFSLSDLPAVGEQRGNSKTFVLEMRPLTALATEIPSLEFSFFNPQTKRYKTVQSAPIPLRVRALPSSEIPAKEVIGRDVQLQEPEKVEKIPIQANYPLTDRDLKDLPFGTWRSLLLLLLFGAAFLGILFYRNYLKQLETLPKVQHAKEVLAELLAAEKADSYFFHLVSQTLLLRLVEKGVVQEMPSSFEKLADSGIQGEVKQFLRALERDRFSGEKKVEVDVITKEVQALFGRIGV